MKNSLFLVPSHYSSLSEQLMGWLWLFWMKNYLNSLQYFGLSSYFCSVQSVSSKSATQRQHLKAVTCKAAMSSMFSCFCFIFIQILKATFVQNENYSTSRQFSWYSYYFPASLALYATGAAPNRETCSQYFQLVFIDNTRSAHSEIFVCSSLTMRSLALVWFTSQIGVVLFVWLCGDPVVCLQRKSSTSLYKNIPVGTEDKLCDTKNTSLVLCIFL